MVKTGYCPECHHPDNGYQHDCPMCGRVLRVRTAWQVSKAMRQQSIVAVARIDAERERRYLDLIGDTYDDRPYCDLCESHGHTFHTCPRRDDECYLDEYDDADAYA